MHVNVGSPQKSLCCWSTIKLQCPCSLSGQANHDKRSGHLATVSWHHPPAAAATYTIIMPRGRVLHVAQASFRCLLCSSCGRTAEDHASHPHCEGGGPRTDMTGRPSLASPPPHEVGGSAEACTLGELSQTALLDRAPVLGPPSHEGLCFFFTCCGARPAPVNVRVAPLHHSLARSG